MEQRDVSVRVTSRVFDGVDMMETVHLAAGVLHRRGSALRLVYETLEDAGAVTNSVSTTDGRRVTVDRQGMFSLHMTLETGIVSVVAVGGTTLDARTREARVTCDERGLRVRLIYTLGGGAPSEHDLLIEATEEAI